MQLTAPNAALTILAPDYQPFPPVIFRSQLVCTQTDESHCENLPKGSVIFHIIEPFSRCLHNGKHPVDKPIGTPAVNCLTMMSVCHSLAQLIAKGSLQAPCRVSDCHPLIKYIQASSNLVLQS